MRSRFSASEISSSSASPRVPTSENACSTCPSAKSSHAAISSRLSCSRCAPSRRRQAGSSFRKVYFTKWRTMARIIPPRDHRPCSWIQCGAVRVALVSPYSWTYPGGVTGHIEALASELTASGHEPRILAPFDPDDTLSARLHRGARPQRRELPDGFVSLGRTVGIPANGAVSNLAPTPHAVFAL